MKNSISSNTQAILLLTAPLIVGREKVFSEVLTLGEYKRLALFLHGKHKQPADLLEPGAKDLFDECQQIVDSSRLSVC